MIAVGAIVGLILVGPKGESTPLITVILAFISPTILALLALLRIENLHATVNGRMDNLIERTEAGAFGRGQVAGPGATDPNPAPLKGGPPGPAGPQGPIGPQGQIGPENKG